MLNSRIQHFVGVSGGKDSAATYCLAVERGRPFRAVAADTGNEDDRWLEYVQSIPRYVGGPEVEVVRADFTAQMAERRRNIRGDWSQELRIKRHSRPCREEQERLAGRPGRSVARVANACDCPISVFPPVADHLIDRAIELLQPSGNPFLDLCMLKGRFPGAKSRFCTEELKLVPMAALKDPLRDAGVSIIEWIGERAQESANRAKKPRMQHWRWTNGVRQLLFRPIHHLKHEDVFAIAKRHGLPPNPLYLEGMTRVGCLPCIMAKKGELRKIAARFPAEIDRLEQWERLVQQVSRRGDATFFPAPMVPGEGDTRANIRDAVQWSKTSRGGRNYDLLLAADVAEVEEGGWLCDSAYGLCE